MLSELTKTLNGQEQIPMKTLCMYHQFLTAVPHWSSDVFVCQQLRLKGFKINAKCCEGHLKQQRRQRHWNIDLSGKKNHIWCFSCDILQKVQCTLSYLEKWMTSIWLTDVCVCFHGLQLFGNICNSSLNTQIFCSDFYTIRTICQLKLMLKNIKYFHFKCKCVIKSQQHFWQLCSSFIDRLDLVI